MKVTVMVFGVILLWRVCVVENLKCYECVEPCKDPMPITTCEDKPNIFCAKLYHAEEIPPPNSTAKAKFNINRTCLEKTDDVENQCTNSGEITCFLCKTDLCNYYVEPATEKETKIPGVVTAPSKATLLAPALMIAMLTEVVLHFLLRCIL